MAKVMKDAWDAAHELVGDVKVRQGRRKVWQLSNDDVLAKLAERRWGPGVGLQTANQAHNALTAIALQEGTPYFRKPGTPFISTTEEIE